MALHGRSKVITDLALMMALGADCLADIALVRAEPGEFGSVASDPKVSCTVNTLAADAQRALQGIDRARAAARAQTWRVAGRRVLDHGTGAEDPLIVDLDAALITAHSEKESAAPTFKRGFGFHTLWASVDHGQAGTGDRRGCLLRKGNLGSNTAADLMAVTRAALAQLPGRRSGTKHMRKVLIRTDGASCTHDFVNWIVSQRRSYSVGFTLPGAFVQTVALMPAEA